MALQKSFNDKWGNSHSAAYCKIDYIQMDTKKQRAVVVMNVYKDQQARNDGKEPIEKLDYVYTPETTTNYQAIFGILQLDNKNPLKSAYDDIKALPEFSAAVDV